MAWVNELPKTTGNVGRPPLPNDEKCNNKIILYVTEEEKHLYQQRAKERNESVSSYIRNHLAPITRKLKAFYEGKTQEEGS